MKSAKEKILDLQDAGITSEYVNEILKQVEAERLESFNLGEISGKALARKVVFKKFQTAVNFNTQHLTEWIKKVTLWQFTTFWEWLGPVASSLLF